jgi:hypothetical protein
VDGFVEREDEFVDGFVEREDDDDGLDENRSWDSTVRALTSFILVELI